jgi:hypothetical protein
MLFENHSPTKNNLKNIEFDDLYKEKINFSEIFDIYKILVLGISKGIKLY